MIEVKKTRCFCKIPIHDLACWARKKYVDNKTTAQLQEEAQTEYEHELVSIVAMLDVSPHELDRLLGHETSPHCNLQRCRDLVKRWVVVVGDTSC